MLKESDWKTKFTKTGENKTPPFLYKFMSAESPHFADAVEKAVLHSKVFHAPATKMNDPFEARPEYIPDKIVDIRKYLKEFEAVFGKGVHITGTKWKDWSIEQGYSAQESKKRVKEDTGTSVQVAQKLSKVAKHLIDESRELTRMACFTSDWTSPLFWALYCSGHNGVCLEFDCPLGTDDLTKGQHGIDKVTYQADRPKVSTVELLKWAGRDNGEKSSAVMTVDEVVPIGTKLRLTKPDSWKHEDEYRSVITNSSLPDYNRISDLTVRRVLVGCMTPQAVFENLVQKYGERVVVARVALEKSSYSLGLLYQ